MARVIAKCDRRSVFSAQTAHRAENKELRPAEVLRIPPHTNILREPEKIAARRLPKHLRRQWQCAFGPMPNDAAGSH